MPITFFNILFTSVGRRVSLVGTFRTALDELGLAGVLIGADMSPTAPAMHVVDVSERVPPVSSHSYVPVLVDLCLKYKVRLLVPLIDPELEVLAQHKADFLRRGTTALVSDPATVEIARDKRKTHDFFVAKGFDTAELYHVEGSRSMGDLPYPLILKPASGSAGVGVTRVDNGDALEFYRRQLPDPIVQEYLQGDEFTLDVLVDGAGRALCVVPRKRLEVRGGEVSKAVTVKDPYLIDVGRRVGEALPGALGPITVQGFLTPEGRFKLTEINARFGGGHPLAIRAGANFPLWIIQMVAGIPTAIDPLGWESGLTMLRYDEAVYVKEEMLP